MEGTHRGLQSTGKGLRHVERISLGHQQAEKELPKGTATAQSEQEGSKEGSRIPACSRRRQLWHEQKEAETAEAPGAWAGPLGSSLGSGCWENTNTCDGGSEQELVIRGCPVSTSAHQHLSMSASACQVCIIAPMWCSAAHRSRHVRTGISRASFVSVSYFI